MKGPIEKRLDLRGVQCPMNYVKVLVGIEEIDEGSQLEVVLDGGKPLVDVSRSAKEDGHTVTSVRGEGDAYAVTIRKGGRK